MEMELESIMLPGIDPQRPIVIAGPCSAETEEQVMETARGIADKGIKLFRAGIWKPRTKPGGFEGIGAEGLQWLKRVKKETGVENVYMPMFIPESLLEREKDHVEGFPE